MPVSWSSEAIVRALHAKLLREHGGLPGLPKAEILESVLARPHDIIACEQTPRTLPELAAIYGFALARSRCFPSGNKSIALAVIDVFLQLNGYELTASEREAVSTLRAVAARSMSEGQLAAWIGAHCRCMAGSS